MTVAVVFAYHDVGARCLQVLLDRGIRVPLVVTHKDDPRENIWFDSVSQLAGTHGIRVATPEDPNTEELLQIITALRPDFIFSFYYRHMLGRPLLDAARLGALNMHGSLLPKYRGRAPVNWAVINGERETGATLHYMVEKADAGDIVDRQAVPIHSNDTALDVFRRVTIAAADVLSRNLSCLVNGTAPRIAQNQKEASYFGARRAEDGRIDWGRSAMAIHNLVRGVAPPYPGALSTIAGKPARVLKTLPQPTASAPFERPHLFFKKGRTYAQCGDGKVLEIVHLELDGQFLTAGHLANALGRRHTPLPTAICEDA
jgi:methionyl-tRNA formyltransferase